MKKELSTYILKLYKAEQAAKQAEDRPLYEKYLAGAAVMLALAEKGAKKEMIMNEIRSHERLWGNAWLTDEVWKGPRNAWEKVKEAL